MRVARTVFRALGLSALAFATGCWSTVPIGHRALVQIVTVDPGRHGETRYAFIIPTPGELAQTTGSSGSGGSNAQVQAIAVMAPSLALAFTHAESLLSRDLYLGQAQQILLSEKLSPRVLNDTLNTLVQIPELDQSQMLFAVKGEAVKAAEGPDPQEVFPAAFLEHIDSCATCADVRLRSNLMTTFLKSRAVYAGFALPEVIPSPYGPTVRGTAFYGTGGKYVLSLGAEDSALYGLALGRTEKVGLDVPVQGLGLVHLRAIKARPAVRVREVHGQVVARARLSATGTVVGIEPNRGLPFSRTHAAIETAAARLIEGRVAGILAKLLGHGLDPMYLGERLYSADPARVPRGFDLATAMKHARVDLMVHVKLTQNGEVR